MEEILTILGWLLLAVVGIPLVLGLALSILVIILTTALGAVTKLGEWAEKYNKENKDERTED